MLAQSNSDLWNYYLHLPFYIVHIYIASWMYWRVTPTLAWTMVFAIKIFGLLHCVWECCTVLYSVYSVLCTVSCCPETGQSRSWACSGPLASVGRSVSAKCPIICFAAWTVLQCYRVIDITALCHIVSCSTLRKYPIDFKYYKYLMKDMYMVSQKKCDPCWDGHNSSEIHQKGKKLVCFGKFSINAAR